MTKSIDDRFSRGAAAVRAVAALAAATLLLAGLAGAAQGADVSADEYLKSVREEGGRVELLDRAKRERDQIEKRVGRHAAPEAQPKPAKSGAGESAPSGTAPSGAEHAHFEQELRSAYPGSYALYTTLGPEGQTKVFAEFQQSRATGSARYIPAVNKIIALAARQR